MKIKFFSLFILLLVITNALKSQENIDPKKNNIFSSLTSTDSLTTATVKIFQDKRIETLLTNKKIAAQTTNGFRVQVFSSNVQKTAKSEAFRIEKLIQEFYPEQPVYVNYTSPFWKVRVGDFKTKSDAQIFKDKLIESVPGLQKETYIVADQVFTSVTK